MQIVETTIHRALLLGAIALVAASAGCSRGELSAAEREKRAQAARATAPAFMGAANSTAKDSAALSDISAMQGQPNAPRSIEDILQSTPLKSVKADCATLTSANDKPTELGVQCPTDPPAKP